MKKGRLWTAEALRDLIDALDVPMTVSRDGTVLMANAAYLEGVGFGAEDIEGRRWVDLLPSEERSRLLEAAKLQAEGEGGPSQAYPLVVCAADGQRQHKMVRTTYLPAEDGGTFIVATCMELPDAQSAQALGEVLGAAASALVAARGEAGALDAVVNELVRAGFGAHVLRPSDEGFDAQAQEAADSGRPVFFGAHSPWAEGAYVPLSTTPSPSPVVMSVRGPGVSSQNAPALNLFGRLCASGLTRARLFEALEHKDRESRRALTETQLLLDLSRTTAGTLELQSILDAGCDFLVRLLDVSNCFILLYDEKAHVLRGAAGSSGHRDFLRQVEIPLDHPGVAATAVRERRAVVVEDTQVRAMQGRWDLVAHFKEKALLCVPLLLRGQTLGAVVLDDTRGPRTFSRETVQLAEASAGLLSLSVANARLYESLRHSYAELEATRAEMVKRERLAALGELSAVVAHEVRNPLGVIFNAVSSLRRLTPDGEGDVRMLLGIIAEESERLDRIVADLLDFARPRALSLQHEDLPKLVREAVEAAQADRAGARKVRFAVEVEEPLPPLPMDRHLLRQALVNVLVNAMQAVASGGTVTLRVAREGEDAVRLEVGDDGPGIPAEMLPRVFEPFFTTKARGTGLGLAVVKRIVEDHDGELRVRSALDQGTTFIFRLPLA